MVNQHLNTQALAEFLSTVATPAEMASTLQDVSYSLAYYATLCPNEQPSANQADNLHLLHELGQVLQAMQGGKAKQ